MWADINGERKKVACGPCIRGHRSSKCDHRDRVLVEVRKPGRPLSSCPHPSGSCSCERVVIKYTIPKSSECGACPSAAERVVPTAMSGNRVQKNRHQKTASTASPSFEKALKAGEQAEADAASITGMSTSTTFTPSERSTSTRPSPSSSVSSTPNILPAPPRESTYGFEITLPDAHNDHPPTPVSQGASSCCKTKGPSVTQPRQEEPPVPSCCSSKTKQEPIPAPVQKSCCAGNSQPAKAEMPAMINTQLAPTQNYAPLATFQQSNPFGGVSYGHNYIANVPGQMNMAAPFVFNSPVYNHMAPNYQPTMPITSHPPFPSQHFAEVTVPEHNCHCGDTCSCFGCAAHPKNSTMVDYLRQVSDFMLTDGAGDYSSPIFDLPAYPHQAGYGAESQPNMDFNSHANDYTSFGTGHLSLQHIMNGSSGLHVNSVHTPNSWQHTQGQIHVPDTFESSYYQIANQPTRVGLEVKTEESSLTPTMHAADSPFDADGEATPTLSPSTYVWQELELPGCNDATGTCQCGDGCACVGCLTHGGHNGVPSTTEPQQTLHDFLAPSDHGMNSFGTTIALAAEPHP